MVDKDGGKDEREEDEGEHDRKEETLRAKILQEFSRDPLPRKIHEINSFAILEDFSSLRNVLNGDDVDDVTAKDGANLD